MKFKGEGMVNGVDGYGFMLTAIDGQLFDGVKYDLLRMKIWDIETGLVVYDNQRGSDDNAELWGSTAIWKGNIVIRAK